MTPETTRQSPVLGTFVGWGIVRFDALPSSDTDYLIEEPLTEPLAYRGRKAIGDAMLRILGPILR